MNLCGVFSEDTFKPADWINNILKNAEANQTMMIMIQVQNQMQKLTTDLKDISKDITKSIPYIIQDAAHLQQQVVELKQKMSEIRYEIVNIEEHTGESINIIERLDTLKKRLQFAKRDLHEADNWTFLANDLEEVLDTRNIPKISKKISEMQQSLQLLLNVTDYDERRLQLEGLKNRLEAIASPEIVQAFSTNNTEQSILFVSIFVEIERLPQIIKYYQKCQRDVLIKKWRNQLNIEQDENIVQWLHNFYGLLLSNWHTQQKWLHQIFQMDVNKAGLYLSEIYCDVLMDLNPPLNESIDKCLKETIEPLTVLLEIRQIHQQFADNLIELIPSEKIPQILQSIYHHFSTYTTKYAEYEKEHLNQQLNGIEFIQEELLDTVRVFGSKISQVFDMIRGAKIRCHDLTENTGIHGLINVLNQFLISYSDQFRVVLKRITRKTNKSSDNWLIFQLNFQMLQNVVDILTHIISLNTEMNTIVVEMISTSEIIDYKLVMLTETGRKDLEQLLNQMSANTNDFMLLNSAFNEFQRLCSDIHSASYQVVLIPIRTYLEYIDKSDDWVKNTGNTDLPDYSFTPHEYITQIGQYIMTIPEHLEPFFYTDNLAFKMALKSVDQEYISENPLTQTFLKLIVRSTCQIFTEKILSLNELNHFASRQLSHDISYLESVLQDIGLNMSTNLQHLALLLKLPADQYQNQRIAGCPARYVAAIRQIRRIII